MEDEVACYDNIAQQDTTWSFYSTNPTSIIEQVIIRERSSTQSRGMYPTNHKILQNRQHNYFREQKSNHVQSFS